MKLVEKIIKENQTNNAFHIAILNDIELVYEPLGQIYGYYNKIEGRKSIHIGNDVPWYHREFTVAHLLFHALTKENEQIILWKNRSPNVHVWSKNEMDGIEFAMKLLFGTMNLSKLISYRELCYVRGCDEKEYQEMRNELLQNAKIDVENMSLKEFLEYIYKFTLNK